MEYLGESERYVPSTQVDAVNMNRAIGVFFTAAKAAVHSVIVFDSAGTKRTANGPANNRGITGEQPSSIADDQNTLVLLICATNFPWYIGTAFLRSYSLHLHIQFPDILAVRVLPSNAWRIK